MKRLLLLFAALLLTLPALAEPVERAAAFAAEHLPGYAFLDGVQFEETAMLLVEDEAGCTYFAGCERDGEDWDITLSTAFPAWMNVSLDTFHAGEGSMRLWTYPDEEMQKYDDEMLGIFIGLQDNGIWQVWGVTDGADVIEFRRQSIYEACGFEYFCDMTLPLDITQVDWSALPRSFEEAMAMFDTSRWAIVKGKFSALYPRPELSGTIISLMVPGAPAERLAVQDNMVQVRFIGSNEVGWMLSGDLYPGEYQISNYASWYEDPDAFRLKEIILDSSDPPITWYAAAHEESTAVAFPVEQVEYFYRMGWCCDACCLLLYSNTLDKCGYVPIDQLP